MKRNWKWPHITLKSPITCLVFFAVGLIAVFGYSVPYLWGAWVQIEQLKAEQASLRSFIADGQHRLDTEVDHPLTPLDENTLIQIQEQLPVTEEIPRFMLQLSKAANGAGVDLHGLHVARSEAELDERMAEPGLLTDENNKREEQKQEAQEKEEQKKEEQKRNEDEQESSLEEEQERSELLTFEREGASPETAGRNSEKTGVQRLWADVYLRASYSNLTTFFSQLAGLSRLTEVVEWRYVLPDDQVPSHVRIRLNVFAYQDEALTDLPPLPEPHIPSAGGAPIDVLPEEPPPEEEEQADESPDPQDLPFLIPFPLVPNEDGSGFVPYEWHPEKNPDEDTDDVEAGSGKGSVQEKNDKQPWFPNLVPPLNPDAGNQS